MKQINGVFVAATGSLGIITNPFSASYTDMRKMTEAGKATSPMATPFAFLWSDFMCGITGWIDPGKEKVSY